MDKKDYYYNPKEFRGKRVKPPRKKVIRFSGRVLPFSNRRIPPFWSGVMVGFVFCALLTVYLFTNKALLIDAIQFTAKVNGWE